MAFLTRSSAPAENAVAPPMPEPMTTSACSLHIALQPASYIALGPTESPADAAAFDVPGGREPGGDEGVAAAVALAGGAPLAGEAAAVRRTVDAAGTATTGDELDWDLVRVVRAKENEQGKRAASFFDPDPRLHQLGRHVRKQIGARPVWTPGDARDKFWDP